MDLTHADSNVVYHIANTTSVLTHLTQVNLNELVVFTAFIWDQVVLELISQRGDLWEGIKRRQCWSADTISID